MQNNQNQSMPHCVVKGEAALWCAVITQALMDASSQSKKSEMKYEKSQAQCWLEGKSEDFHVVCDYAGFEPSYIRKESASALQRNCQWRAPAKSQPKKELEMVH